ncbi:MAG TPA: complex I NDUFA9 subunit family protein [Alphaproteobacteria bacterium]|nr:complex I NDUFA9 subunit family protein [Alphaproteobacteria bacterium]
MANRRVTVFGGSGFIGRHLVRRLAAHGDVLRIAVRDPEGAAFLKPMGDVAQIVPMRVDIRDEATVRAAVQGADAVVNLVGILFERGRQSFAEIQARGPGRIARAARAAGVKRLVHVSALGADLLSPSVYGRTKAEGEAAMRDAFPAATIMRPSVVFGPEDRFFNRFGALARMLPVLPVFRARPRLERYPEGGARLLLCGDGGTRFQPVYVGDVAAAIFRALEEPSCQGQTYELGGPRVYSFREIMGLVLHETQRRRLLVPVPLWLAEIEAALLGLVPLPEPLLTRDQVRLMRRDNVVAPGAPGLAELGIVPVPAEAILPTYMDIYRRGGRYRSPRPA